MTPSRRRGRTVAAITVVVAAAALLAGCVVDLTGSSSGRDSRDASDTSDTRDTGDADDPGAAYAEVGECVTPRPSSDLAEQVDCAAPDATYVVGKRLEGLSDRTCPTESYDSYGQEGDDGDFVLCLIMNGSEGDCFNGYSHPDEPKAKVPCDDAHVRVIAAFDGKADRDLCPAGSEWRLDYPVPAPGRTVCLDAKAAVAPA